MRTFSIATIILAAVMTLACGPASETATEAPPADQYLVYFGTFTRGVSQGVYVSKLTPATGELTEPVLAAKISNPGWVTIHPNQKYLYAVGEAGTLKSELDGPVTAFSIDKATGMLTPINTVDGGGGGACHLNVDPSGRMLAGANYGGGSVVTFPVRPDGSLGEVASFIQHEGSSVDPSRQKAPHAHSADFTPDGKFVLFCDLGTDKITVYKADPATAKIEPNDPPAVDVEPGSGPRHFAFHPNGRYGYGINEMASTITAYQWDAAAGKLTPFQTVPTLPEDFDGKNTTAEIEAHPSGKFIYGSNRGHDSIAAFSVDEATGKLTLIEQESSGGKTPRGLGVDPTGHYAIAGNQDTDNVFLLRIEDDGSLTPAGTSYSVGAPVCVRFLGPI